MCVFDYTVLLQGLWWCGLLENQDHSVGLSPNLQQSPLGMERTLRGGRSPFLIQHSEVKASDIDIVEAI